MAPIAANIENSMEKMETHHTVSRRSRSTALIVSAAVIVKGDLP